MPATPATGAPAPIRILSVSAENVEPGDSVRVRFRVTNTGQGAETAIVVVGGGLKCTTGCRAEPRLGPGKSRDFTTTLIAPKAGAGEVTGLNISVAVRLGAQNSYDHKMVYVHGPGTSSPGKTKPSTGVDRVTGRVRDTEGKAVGGAVLTVRDSAGHTYRTTSDRSGRFSVEPDAGQPIVAGRLRVAATLDGYRTARATVRGRAGHTANVQLTLKTVATPVKTSQSPEAAASPLATADGASEPEASVEAAAPPDLEAVSDESSGPLPGMILGGLLVALGLSALALMVIRRRNAPAPTR